MHCPFCGADNTQVTDTRQNEDGDTVRRRRRCLSCDKRFTTYERIDLIKPMNINTKVVSETGQLIACGRATRVGRHKQHPLSLTLE